MFATKDHFPTLFSHALQAHGEGKYEVAGSSYKQILEDDPNHWEAAQAFGILHCQMGQFDEGAKNLEHASTINPSHAELWSNLGNVYRILNRHQEASEACRKAIELNPKLAVAWNNLSASLRCEGNLKESITAAAKAAELAPGYGEAFLNWGVGLLGVGDQALAIEKLRISAELTPSNLHAWSNLLFATNYSDKWSAADVAKLHKVYGEMFPQAPHLPLPLECKTVGFVSADFKKHPVGEFILPILRRLQAQGFKVVLYANQIEEDSVTGECRAACDQFHHVLSLSDSDFSVLIKKDEVDLLVDLSGHSGGSRLGVFILRSAPVQATFLGYSNTTGLASMDFIIGDSSLVPRKCEALYTECVVRLGSTYFTTKNQPKGRKPSAKPLQFGSFNNPAKITPRAVELWSMILNATPESNLLLQYRLFDSEFACDRYRTLFANHGIPQERVRFVGSCSKTEHEKLLQQTDLVLDSLPYTGATTTLEALSRAVPVLTLRGDSYTSRMSASLLGLLDLEDLVCESPEEYVQKAIYLAQDRSNLHEAHLAIVENWASSGLGNGERCGDAFINVIDDMWNIIKVSSSCARKVR